MGKIYVAKIADGSERDVAQFSNNRAKLFFAIARLLENYVEIPCGIAEDTGPYGPQDEHRIDGEQFVRFFHKFWRIGWLSDNSNSIVSSWTVWGAGIVENITLSPVRWIDRCGVELSIRRYQLSDSKLEELLIRKKEGGEVEVIHSANNETDTSR